MCSLALALTGLTTGLQMAGQYQQSRAQAAAYEAQAQAAQQQAEAERQNANIEGKKLEISALQRAEEQRKLTAKLQLAEGQNRATAGALGISSDVGSPLDVYNSSLDAYIGDSTRLLDNMRYDNFTSNIIQTNHRNRANAYDAEAANYYSQASAAKQAGVINMFGTALGAGSSLLGGASSSSLSKANKTWVGNVPRSQYEATGIGTGRYMKTGR